MVDPLSSTALLGSYCHWSHERHHALIQIQFSVSFYHSAELALTIFILKIGQWITIRANFIWFTISSNGFASFVRLLSSNIIFKFAPQCTIKAQDDANCSYQARKCQKQYPQSRDNELLLLKVETVTLYLLNCPIWWYRYYSPPQMKPLCKSNRWEYSYNYKEQRTKHGCKNWPLLANTPCL